MKAITEPSNPEIWKRLGQSAKFSNKGLGALP